MLRGIDPALNADILYALRAMGHGDDLVIADANFPAETMAKRLIRMEAISSPEMLRKVLTVFPVDDFVDEPLLRIEVVGDPEAVPPVCVEMQKVLDETLTNPPRLGRIDRFDFYERAREAYCVIATGEPRLYGCILLKKGVIRPEESN
ncbi:MAG: RbsD/FucU family protein [Alphaproteobacteria bacterium]